MRTRLHIRDYHEVQSDPPPHVLYQFYIAEKRRERRWRTAKLFAKWILCGAIVAGLCWHALRIAP
jgi:hypothetical protein